MAQGDVLEGSGRGNRRMEWVFSMHHMATEQRLSSITTHDKIMRYATKQHGEP